MSARNRSRRTPAAAQFNPEESPLGWLARRRDKNGEPMISQAQYLAGEKLRADFTFANMAPRLTTNYSDAPMSSTARRGAPGAGIDIADNVIAATERVRRALVAVGPELSGVLIDVCCHLKGLEEAERKSAWPQRAGKVVLQLALTRLARHYCIEDTARPHSRGIEHWGSDGYRPEISDAST